ncbi:MAG: 50S ribosomal protein L9 [Kiritimatiellia bacterium]|nr:50S ribosomal protein L9 [Lentisphaerota bacterium]
MLRELILMADVDGLGLEGSIVKVNQGYARNYLIPRKLAVPVNQAALRRLEKNRREREERQQSELEAARRKAEALAQVSCTITVKVGEGEKIFGSVSVADILEALKAQGFDLERRRIILSDPIRELGVYDVKVRLHQEVEAAVKVWVVGE